MINRKKLRIGMFFVFGILLISLVSAYTETNAQYTQFQSPGLFTDISSLQIDPSMCEKGQDFVVQLTPFGCTPAVVRSDLLEEQNVPVYCQLSATKINPLIDVKAIDGIQIVGDTPPEVAGIGFQPARAALGVKTQGLESSIMENIGYAVIVLKQQSNESALTGCEDSDAGGDVCWVEGELKTNIKYDVKNAFGIGKVTHVLPKLTDSEWEDTQTQYSFWNAKGYLRAEEVNEDSAVISVYDNINKVRSLSISKGSLSEKVYLPGFSCLSSLQLRLDDLESPDTRVKLRINNDYVEVKKGEKFLEDRCFVLGMSDAGITKRATIKCKEDDQGVFGSKAYELSIAPRVEISINGVSESYNVGDLLYEYNEGNDGAGRKNRVYLGYVSSKSGKNEDLQIGVINLPEDVHRDEKLSNDELKYIGKLSETHLSDMEKREEITVASLLEDAWSSISGVTREIYTKIVKGKSVTFISHDGTISILGQKGAPSSDIIYGKKIEIIGFAGPRNVEFNIGSTDEKKAKEYYDLAEENYDTLITNYASEKGLGEKIFGEEALYAKIELNRDLKQKAVVFELCETFKEKYPSSKFDLSVCDSLELSNEDTSSVLVFVNGKTSRITLADITEPTFEEFSAKVEIRGPNGNRKTISLRKNQPYSLEEFRPREDEFISVKIGGFSTVSYKYVSSRSEWQWLDGQGNNKSVKSSHENNQYPTLNADLIGENFVQGIRIINAAQDNFLETEVIELLELEPGKAKVRVSVWGKDVTKRIKDTLIGGAQTLKLNEPQSFGSDYSFVLSEVNLKKEAKVTIIPSIQDAGSQTNFSFRIGIEKRGIQLSPSQTMSRIKDLNKTIDEWEDKGEKVGTAVETFKTACLVGGAALTVKNFFANAGGKGLARQEAMNGPGGWKEICADKVDKGEKGASTMGECYNTFGQDIEKSVNDLAKVKKQQNDLIKERTESISLEDSNGSPTFDSEKYGQKALPKIKETLEKSGFIFKDSKGNNISYDFINYTTLKDSSTPEQWAKIEESAMVLGDKNIEADSIARKISEKRLNSVLGDVHTASLVPAAKNTLEARTGVSEAHIIPDRNTKTITFSKDETWESISSKYPGATLSQRDVKIQVVKYIAGKEYLVTLDDGNRVTKTYEIQEGNILNAIDGTNPLNLDFQKRDASSYKNNKIKNPKVKYYETPPYDGMPAIVPFDIKNGWYASIKQDLPIGGGIESYSKSGRVSSFFICNVGENGIIDGEGKDECMLINTGTGQPSNVFSGLNENEARALITKANKAVQAAKTRQKGRNEVDILGQIIEIGSPAADISGLQCQDFMSPQDCKILFNLCDPVICPSDRCNLGGEYPVKDPIQTGIIGGLVLCLPNWKEGVYLPVCLSAIKAGIDGLVSIFGSYRDCLQESLDTGQTVGICDEMHSIYLCEFFWKQALPLAEIGLPKLIAAVAGQTSVKGGGQYIGVQSAWDTSKKSISYFTQTYAASAFSAFKARSTEEIGGTVCKNFVSGVVPNLDFLDTLTDPDSPPQFHGRFDEIPFSTVTNPPTSHYKVFYHIFAGKDSSGQYKVYLRGSSDSSFYQDSSSSRLIAQGYMKKGETISETKDFTAPSGYKELCMIVNGQEECGFKQVSTSFALDYVKDKAIEEQAIQTDITSQTECISGSASAYSLLNLNVQEGVGDLANPAIYNDGIIRVCSTGNPGQGTDGLIGTEKARWKEVGYCGTQNLKCWLDTSRIDDITSLRSTKDSILSDVSNKTLKLLEEEGKYENNFDEKLIEILDPALENDQKLLKIGELLDKVFFNSRKAELYLLRGEIYHEMAKELFEKAEKQNEAAPAVNLAEEKAIQEALQQQLQDKPGQVMGTQDSSSEVTLESVMSQLDDREKVIVNNAETMSDCKFCGGSFFDLNICGNNECLAISLKLNGINPSWGCNFNQWIRSCSPKVGAQTEVTIQEKVTQNIKFVFYGGENDIAFIRWNIKDNNPEAIVYPNGGLNSNILNRQKWSKDSLSQTSFVSAGMYQEDIVVFNNILTSTSLEEFKNNIITSLSISDSGIESNDRTYTSKDNRVDIENYLSKLLASSIDKPVLSLLSETQFKTSKSFSTVEGGGFYEIDECIRYDDSIKKWRSGTCSAVWPGDWNEGVGDSLELADFETGYWFITYLNTEYKEENKIQTISKFKLVLSGGYYYIYYNGKNTNLYLYKTNLGYQIYNDDWFADTLIGSFQEISSENFGKLLYRISSSDVIFLNNPGLFDDLSKVSLTIENNVPELV